MNVDQTSESLQTLPRAPVAICVLPRFRLRFWREFRIVVVLLLLGSSAIPARTAGYYQLGLAVAGNGFNLVEWELKALTEKAQALFAQPSRHIAPAVASQVVQSYLVRASCIGAIERVAKPPPASGLAANEESVSVEQLNAQLSQLRFEQDEARPAVEQIIQRQIGTILLEQGFSMSGLVWPPVQFTFTEPPRKLIVSPRDQIATIYYQMLSPEMELAAIEAAEEQIGEHENAVGYITQIGGSACFRQWSWTERAWDGF